MWRPVPDNAQHSQQTDINGPAGFKPTIPASEWIQIDASHCKATWIGNERGYIMHFFVFMSLVSLGAAGQVKHPGWWRTLAEPCPPLMVNCL
jgi:hypothetical protein